MVLFFGYLSITGAIKMGNSTPGIIPAINRNADNKVEPVSSKTIRLMGRLIVCPAMADMIVPMVIRVKSLDHTFSSSISSTPRMNAC